MFNSSNENNLIVTDIVDVMQDYCSIQLDIDSTRAKAAQLVAQNIDLKRLVGKDTLDRCIDPQTDADNELVELIIPPLCYYTYSRVLRLFQGNLTDSGFVVETDAESRDASRTQANEIYSIAEVYMQEVIAFLDAETPNDKIDQDKMTPSIRVFGGGESRSGGYSGNTGCCNRKN